ncbi:MAG: bifunctional proline dehydrogenase/L-glutamate gamma-semialdehyde dehydrogenase PutA [Parvularculaceae bacterium]|nr:bifunctional proline dehydrogenase/L-glutamate gamma-semialdehyde dehydrogenase PutA [Parvularculaceae bacterium]
MPRYPGLASYYITGMETLPSLRAAIRAATLADETAAAHALLAAAALPDAARHAAQEKAAAFVKEARATASRSTLVDKFLQEYGLSTAEGVTLMRLAEALLRTPDAATADALIKDKVDAGDWAAHQGKSPFPLVNFSTRALMLTAAWLDDVEAKDPGRKLVKATKDALDRVGEPVIRAAVAQAMKIMGEHFVLGETISEAQRRGQGYAKKGYNFSFDMLGEAAHTAADAAKYFKDYETAIAEIARGATASRSVDNPGISVKLSALHPRYEYGKRARVLEELGSSVAKLAIQAKNANIGFNIDAEEAARLDLSLDLIEALMRDEKLAGWDGFGVVVQAYQRRAMVVIDWLAAMARETGRRIMVRLVKGAYWDGEIKRAQVMGLASYPVFTRKVLTDVSYQACARKLFANADVIYPQFATHNALTATLVREMAGDVTEYELQRLHGMGEALHDTLIAAGARSRIYAPVGGHKELLPYLVRRLLENGANSSFVNQLFDPDHSIDRIVADPVEEARSLAVFPNPAIPAPRDLFKGERLAAEGWDETDPETGEQLELAVGAALKSSAVYGPLIDALAEKGPAAFSVNPSHTDEIIGTVRSASAVDVSLACDKAALAAPHWAATPARERAAILRRAADLLEARAEQFLQLAVREAGKTIPDAIAEVREAIDFLRYYANEAVALKGEPLGVVACISPWNFPLAIFLGQVSAALAAGNAVIAKPAEQTPIIAHDAAALLHEAGVPRGVLQCLPGDGPSVGAPLVADKRVAGVVFTGSTEVAQIINRGLVDAGKWDAALIAETGGINAMIVDSTALLEQAVRDAVSSAFQSAGQRCSAARVVCVQEDVADRFNEMLAGAVAELVVGDPSLLSTDVGPVIDEEARASIAAYVEALRGKGKVVAEAAGPCGSSFGTRADGRAPQDEEPLHPEERPSSGRVTKDRFKGTFVRPIAIEINALSDLTREVFGPVLHIVRFPAASIDTLVSDINALGFGLTLGLHTRIDETMHAVVARARVGNIYVNRNQIGAVVGVQPFGGDGLSGTGPKAGGPHYLPALQKRAAPAGTGVLGVSATAPMPLFDQQLRRAAAAFERWNEGAGRRDTLVRAAAAARDDAAELFRLAVSLYAEHFEAVAELPGPTGESNTLRLKGRGVVLCLGGGNDAANRRQLALALAGGNAIVAVEPLAEKASRALTSAGAPEHLVVSLTAGGAVNEAALLDPRVRAVAFDGESASRKAICETLARRTGPIAPLLSSADSPARFATERTLTINTTAAGGDVRLLSLPE